MGVDYRIIVIGKCWNEKEYSIKGDFWCNRFRDIIDDLNQISIPEEISKIIKDFSDKEWKDDYIPEARVFDFSVFKDYINEKKEALEKTKKELAILREERTKSQSDKAFENFSELINDAEQMIAYYQEECIDYVQALMNGLCFYASDVLDLFGDYYFATWACW